MKKMRKLWQWFISAINMGSFSSFFEVAAALATGTLLLICLGASRYRVEYFTLLIIFSLLVAAVIVLSERMKRRNPKKTA